MKKKAIITLIPALALSLSSCQFVKDKINDLTGNAGDSELVVDSTFNSESVYEEVYVETENSEDQDSEEVIISASEINELLDLYDAYCEELQGLLQDKQRNADKINRLKKSISEISEKISRIEPDRLTSQQIYRHKKQKESYEMLLKSYN